MLLFLLSVAPESVVKGLDRIPNPAEFKSSSSSNPWTHTNLQRTTFARGGLRARGVPALLALSPLSPEEEERVQYSEVVPFFLLVVFAAGDEVFGLLVSAARLHWAVLKGLS